MVFFFFRIVICKGEIKRGGECICEDSLGKNSMGSVLVSVLVTGGSGNSICQKSTEICGSVV